MFLNFLFIPTLLAALAFAFAGFKTSSLVRSTTSTIACSILALLLAIPALLFVVYYGHVLDRAAWYYAFRAAPYSELTASGLGFGLGFLVGVLQRQLWLRNPLRFRVAASATALICLAILFVPYMKPLLAPIRRPLRDQWSQGVSLQTSSSTCGPSSAATLLRQFNIAVSERELARECFSYRGGTENWYVARALQHHGVEAHYLITNPEPANLPFPSMAGVQMGGLRYGGHFITILGRQSDSYIIGDPLIGRLVLTPKQLHDRYYFTGFFLVVSRPRSL